MADDEVGQEHLDQTVVLLLCRGVDVEVFEFLELVHVVDQLDYCDKRDEDRDVGVHEKVNWEDQDTH